MSNICSLLPYINYVLLVIDVAGSVLAQAGYSERYIIQPSTLARNKLAA